MKKTISKSYAYKKPVSGLDGIAQSLLNVGIPVVIETPMENKYRSSGITTSSSVKNPFSLGSEPLRIKL